MIKADIPGGGKTAFVADMLEGGRIVGTMKIYCDDREDAFRRMMDLAEGQFGVGKACRGKTSIHPLGASHSAEWRLRKKPELMN